MNGIIYGDKCVLFPFETSDLKQFVDLHRNDKQGYMQKFCLKAMTEEEAVNYVKALFITNQIKAWSVYPKNHKEKRCSGFIYLTDLTTFSANISGIMNSKIMKGLLRHLRHGETTYAEDSVRSLVNHCFNGAGFNRIETTVLANNRRALALDRKCGFVEEGRLRDAFQMDDKFYDVILFAILKKDWGD